MITHPQRWPVYSDQARLAVDQLVSDGRSFDYGYGPEIATLESEFSELTGAAHCLALGSGTSALLAAYFALGIGPGDEVIVSDYTFFSSASPLFLLGAVPVLADSCGPNGNVDPVAVEALLSSRTVAISVTHLWGQPADVGALIKLADRNGLALIEDCSHAHGSTVHGRSVGTFGDVGVFSIGGLKAISGGMGGMLVAKDREIVDRACLLASFRRRTELTVTSPGLEDLRSTGLGGNFRITPIAAVLALDHVRDLDNIVAVRQANMEALLARLCELDGISRVPRSDHCSNGAWYDGVASVTGPLASRRDDLVQLLTSWGLKVDPPSTDPLHRYPIFRGQVPRWAPLPREAATLAAQRNCRPFTTADQLSNSWIKLPVNYLWQPGSELVERYADAFERAVGELAAA